MSPRPPVCVITGFGINADAELARAFEMAGADPRRTHVADLIAKPKMVLDFRILAIPGGFSFGDHLGSGKVFATLFRRNLGEQVGQLLSRGGLVIGICNGFQVLVKMGILPNTLGAGAQEVSLVHNDSGRYEDRWVKVRFDEGSRCLWTRGLREMDVPVRHGEGKFVTRSADQLPELQRRGLIALRYAAADGGEPGYPDDPNGSEGHVAGICDPSGRVFGLMPHPEAFTRAQNHPDWTARAVEPEGIRIFKNGVKAAGE
jgi:phosphoribosylformylglycinamidine synthase subunit PurQ / glutaminase